METKQQTQIGLSYLVSEQLGIRQDAVTGTADWTQLGADSLDRLAISLAIEETFHVDIPHGIGERLNTVSDTLEHLYSLMAARDAISDGASVCNGDQSIVVTASMRQQKARDGETRSKQQLLKRLGQMCSDQLGVSPEWITDKATWLDLGADSLDRLAISLAIEDAFYVEIPHEVGERLNTVGDTVDHVWKLICPTVPIVAQQGGLQA